ncbi:NADH-quinone oxidoreductase subunit J family protein [Methanomassiliicoccus luminyensis]|jgi:NADH:ubiquinone oxidoreductase subunit 6 (subunit J)|uniref:NADH-quinone oxidoreductase subunit J family protein n=1 Tax=Methanomassiliicoccus luminyensis TaxID=1080712 RepID=UPI0003747268|nr:NADH-quinone oxidoreductase subunit J [Methanomassiliicoccus luminyensis]
MVEWDLLFFLIFAAMTIASAIAIVWTKEIVRSIVWLAFTFIGVAVIYIFLGAEFLAIIQVLVYVGAVSVLMLFGIMLTKRRLVGGERNE